MEPYTRFQEMKPCSHPQALLRNCLLAGRWYYTKQIKHCPWPQGERAVRHGLTEKGCEDNMTTDKVSLQTVAGRHEGPAHCHFFPLVCSHGCCIESKARGFSSLLLPLRSSFCMEDGCQAPLCPAPSLPHTFQTSWYHSDSCPTLTF